MSKFVASNGIEVSVTVNEHELTPKSTMFHITRHEQDALREYFQHMRDQALGRWRSKANPSWVVYPRLRGALRVIDEVTATVYALKRGWDPAKTENRVLARVVAEYRESLPKPWREAKSGEVWVLDGEPYSVVRDSDGVIDAGPRFFRVNADKWYPGHADRDFTTGHRIWPTEEATK